jgi:bacteriocin-like protein
LELEKNYQSLKKQIKIKTMKKLKTKKLAFAKATVTELNKKQLNLIIGGSLEVQPLSGSAWSFLPNCVTRTENKMQ